MTTSCTCFVHATPPPQTDLPSWLSPLTFPGSLLISSLFKCKIHWRKEYLSVSVIRGLQCLCTTDGLIWVFTGWRKGWAAAGEAVSCMVRGLSCGHQDPSAGKCVYIYIYIFSFLFGTGARACFLEHFTSDLYHLSPYSKLCCQYWLDIIFQRLSFVKIVDFNSLICCQQTSTGRHTDGTFKES